MTVPILDRIPSLPDPVRRTTYNMATLLDGLTPRSYTWRCDLWLDQGSEGACVAHAWAHEAAARPVIVQFPQPVPGDHRLYPAQQFAFAFYDWCRRNDEWPGEDYDGTSVAAGARGIKALGLMPEYRWSDNADEIAVAVSRKGPVVLGVDWWTGMFNTDSNGYLNLTGRVQGGHAILCNGYNTRTRSFRLHNSWGQDWGINGEALLRHEDMRHLMATGGEACLPVRRTLAP